MTGALDVWRADSAWVARLGVVAAGTRTLSLGGGEAAWRRATAALGVARRWGSPVAFASLGADALVGASFLEGRGFAVDETRTSADLGAQLSARAGARLAAVPLIVWGEAAVVGWAREQRVTSAALRGATRFRASMSRWRQESPGAPTRAETMPEVETQGGTTLVSAMPRHQPSPADAAGLLTLEEVYRLHARAVARWAERLGGPRVDHEEIVQEVFLIVDCRLAEFRGEAKLTTWLFRITTRVVANHRRRVRRRGLWARLTRRIEEITPAATGGPGERARG